LTFPDPQDEVNNIQYNFLSLCRSQQLTMPSRLSVLLVSLLLAAPAVAFWLWLVIVPARVAMLCPEECECDSGGYSVKCESLSVKYLPLIHLTNVQVLQLYFKEMTLLENDSFVSMTELLLLDLRGCGLRTIELGAFNGLRKLTRLSMQGNKISEILTGTFENMKRLHYLDLSNNKLQRVDSALFSGLVNLITVDLSANKLHYFHPDTFLELSNIKHLHLQNNWFLQIPTDRKFINSHSLSTLDISHCNISSVSVETFANVSALQRLDLRENNLRSVDINILRALPELSELYLYGNPLQCDCQLLEVWRWCEDRNIRTVYRSLVPECDTPIEVKGMWLGILEKGLCLEGNIEYCGDYRNTSCSETDIGKHKDQNKHGNDYDDEFFKQYQLPVYAVAFVFGTTANVILLIIIICNKDMRNLPNMYILNLAISDIIYLTVLFSEACANRMNDMRVNDIIMCKFVSFCRRMSVGLSAYSAALYSFQRYSVTLGPTQFRDFSQPKQRSVVATFFGVWLVAALFAFPSTLTMNLCAQPSDVTIITYYQHVVIFELLVSCVLPLIVIAFSYTMTARHFVESSRAISEGTQNPQLKTRRNVAKIVVGLTVVFVISYVHYHVFWTYLICRHEDIILYNMKRILDYSNHKAQYMYLTSNCFLLINPCVNPEALFCTSSQFRQHLKRYLTCFCKTSFPSTDYELARRN